MERKETWIVGTGIQKVLQSRLQKPYYCFWHVEWFRKRIRRAAQSKASSGIMRKNWESQKFRKVVSKAARKSLSKRWKNDSKFRKTALNGLKSWRNDLDKVRLTGRKISRTKRKNRDKISIQVCESLRDRINEHRKYKRCSYRGVVMRSTWEVEFAKLLSRAHIKWSYEPRTFVMGIGRRYTPDFYLPDTGEFIEVKPRIFVNNSVMKKVDFVRKAGFKISLVDKKEMKKFISKIRSKVAEEVVR